VLAAILALSMPRAALVATAAAQLSISAAAEAAVEVEEDLVPLTVKIF
jgi:predicted secreted protein